MSWSNSVCCILYAIWTATLKKWAQSNIYFDQLKNWSKWANRYSRFVQTSPNRHNDGFVQDCSISSALAMEILQSCAKPWIWYQCICGVVCPLFFRNIFCKTWIINWSPNGPSMVGSWVARWIHGWHLATGRPYFSSTDKLCAIILGVYVATIYNNKLYWCSIIFWLWVFKHHQVFLGKYVEFCFTVTISDTYKNMFAFDGVS